MVVELRYYIRTFLNGLTKPNLHHLHFIIINIRNVGLLLPLLIRLLRQLDRVRLYILLPELLIFYQFLFCLRILKI